MDNTNTVPSTEISLNYNAAAGRPLKRIEALNQRKKWLGDNNWNDITPGRELPSKSSTWLLILKHMIGHLRILFFQQGRV